MNLFEMKYGGKSIDRKMPRCPNNAKLQSEQRRNREYGRALHIYE
jgi:hypothetical protein